jgi:hypothetical protein
VGCNSLIFCSKDSKALIKNAHPELFKGMTFRLNLANVPGVPYRLLTLYGDMQFKCLTCKFFKTFTNVDPVLRTQSVLVIERPTPGENCPSFSTVCISDTLDPGPVGDATLNSENGCISDLAESL